MYHYIAIVLQIFAIYCIGEMLQEVSEYLHKLHQNIIHNHKVAQAQWLPFKSSTIRSVIVTYHNNVYVSKTTLQICSAVNQENNKAKFAESHDEATISISEYHKSISDLFTPLVGKPPNTILIEGAPGIGKTTLANEIALKWKSIPLLCDREFLFLIYLKDPQVQKAKNLNDLLHVIFQNDKLSTSIDDLEKLIFMNNGANLAMIFDGYDELPRHHIKRSFISSIIRRSYLKSSLLIITSRPSFAKKLHIPCCRKVEILGFTEADRDLYIKSSLNEPAIIIEHFRKYPAINAYCRIPFNLNMLLYLYCHSNGYLPVTKTELFKKFIDYSMCAKQACLPKYTHKTKTDEGLQQLLKEFGKLSFDTLKANKLAFSHQDLQITCRKYLKVKQGNVKCPFGLLQISHWLGSQEISYSFLHVGIQEYLAAWHLSEQGLEVKAMLDYFWDERFFNMWVFYIGITKGKQLVIDFEGFIRIQIWWKNDCKTTRLLRFNIINDKMKCLHLVQCYMEAEDKDCCQMISDFLFNEFVDLSNRHMLYEGLNTLCFAIIHSLECCLTELNLANCRIGDDGCKYIHTQLVSAPSNLTIGVLNLSENQLTGLSVNFIIDLVLKLNTKALILSGNQLCCDGTSKLIQNSSTLYFLDVTNNNVLSEDTALLNYFYSNTTSGMSIVFSKETVCLSNCDCEEKEYGAYLPKFYYHSFSVILTTDSSESSNYIDNKIDNVSLRSLYLNCTLNENLDIFCAWMKELKLSKLHLIINPKHSEKVYSVITRMKTLTEVCIGQLNNDTADKIVKKLNIAVIVTSLSKFQAKYSLNAETLLANFRTFSFQSLHTIRIENCSIEINMLAAAIVSNNHWDSIGLLECNLGDEELSNLCDGVCSSKQITVHSLNLKWNNIKHVGSLNNLLHQWKTKRLNLECNDLQYAGFMDIVISAKQGDLELEYLDMRNNSITGLEDLCEDLLFDVKYKVNLSLLSSEYIVSKNRKFYTEALCFLVNCSSLNLYIQPVSDCFNTFKVLSNLLRITSIQKLYVIASAIDFKSISLLIQMQASKPFDLYLNVRAMGDRDIDYLVKRFPHKSIYVQSETKLTACYFKLKKNFFLLQSKIISLSLYQCILDKDSLSVIGKIIANSHQTFQMIDLCHCSLCDADLQVLLKEKQNYMPFIKVFSLSGNALAASSINELLCYWRVEHLSVCSNQLQDSGVKDIVKCVVQSNNVRSVDLTDNDASLQLKEVCKENFFEEHNKFSFVLMDNGLLAVQHISEVCRDFKGVTGLYIKESPEINVVLLPQNCDSLRYLYIVCSQIHSDEFKNSLQFLHQIKELYLHVENLVEKDADAIADSFGEQSVGCVIVTHTKLKMMNADESLTVKGLSTCRHSVVTVELNNCMINFSRAIQCLAKIFNSCSGSLFQAFKLNKCCLEDHHFNTLLNTLNDKNKLIVKQLDLSHNLLSSVSSDDVKKMYNFFMPEHLVISNNRLSYDSVLILLTIDCTNLKYLSLQHNNFAHSDTDRLCKQVAFDRRYKLQCLLIAESLIVDVTACSEEIWDIIKGEVLKKLYIKLFSSIHQSNKYTKYLKKLLSSFCLLESLFLFISGPFDFDKNLLNVLQRIQISKRLVLYIEKLPDDTFSKLVASFTSSIGIELFSQKKVWISNSDCKMINVLLKYISCEEVDCIFVANTPSIHEHLHLLANTLLCQCKQIKQISLARCCSKDSKFDVLFQTISSQFQQVSFNMLALTRLNLSFNQLLPYCMPSLIKTVFITRVEELILTGNKIGFVGAKMLIEELTMDLNTVKYININHNEIYKPETLCQKYFIDLKFEYSFLATSSGIIITKGFLTDYPAIWQDEYLTSFSSVYLARKGLLSSLELQNIIIKSNQKLKQLYMVLLQNSELQLNSDQMNLVDIQELCLFTPLLGSKSRINIWGKYCQSKSDKQKVLLLSKEALQAKNFESEDSSNVLLRAFEYCRSLVVNIQLINCKLSSLIMNNLTQVLINNRELHHLEICDTDDCEIGSTILNKQDITIQIKSITLFNNNLTMKFLNSFISFVNCWSVDELFIKDNKISFDGFKKLVRATGTGKSPLKTLHTLQNFIEIEKAQELCKTVYFDSVYSIGCLRIKENNFDFLVIKPTLSSYNGICSYTDDFVKSHYQSKSKEKHSTSQSSLFVETDYDSIDPLVWTCASKLCIMAPVKDQESLVSNLKENKSLSEIYLYVNSLKDSSLKEISKNLPASCQTTVFLTAEVFIAKNAGLLYVDKGLQILSSTTILHTIIINHCSLSIEMLMLLNHILEHGHLWECLDLSHCSLGDNIKHILQPLSGEITIKAVRLSFNGLQQTTAASIIKTILHWNTEDLFINDNNLRDTGVHKVVAEVCKHSKKCQLTVLNLSNNGVTLDKARSSLIKVHKALSSRQLLLSMDDAILVQETQRFPSSLIWTSIIQTSKLFYSFNCGQEVIFSIKPHLASINEIVLCNNDFHESNNSKNLAEIAFKSKETIIITLLYQNLKAQNCHLTLIQMVFKENVKINSLDFSFCEVDNNLLTQIANLIQCNRHLQLLSLKGCNLSNDFCKILLNPLQDTNNLQVNSLNLSSNNIRLSAVEDLSKLCCILKTENLCLDNNELSGNGIERLVNTLNGENHNLQYIKLTDNNTHYLTEYEFNRLCNTTCTVEINPRTQTLYKSLPLFLENMETIDNLYCIECTFSIQSLEDVLSLKLNRLHLLGTLDTSVSKSSSFCGKTTVIRAKEIIIVLKNCDDTLAFELFRKADTIPIVIVSKISILAKNIEEAGLINIVLQQCQKHCLKKFLLNSCNVTKCFKELASQLNSVSNKHLEDFQMRNCFLSHTSLIALVKSLTLIRITSDVVDLSCNQITTESAEIIGTMVKDWQIKKLCLNDNQMSQEGINSILSACVLMYYLQDITFEGNIDAKDLQQAETVVDNAVSKFLSLDSKTYFNESLNNYIIMVVCRLLNFHFLRVSVITSDEIVLEGDQNSLKMTDIRVYINARNLASFHNVERIFKSTPNLYQHSEEIFILYELALSHLYREKLVTNSAMNVKLVYSKETPLKEMEVIRYPCIKVRMNSIKLIPKLFNICMLSGITDVSVVIDVTSILLEGAQQSFVNNTIRCFLNDVNKISSLKELIFKSQSVAIDFLTIVPELITSSPCLESMNVMGNDLDDTRFLQIGNQLHHLMSLHYLNLSHNGLSSFCMPRIIELMSSCPIKELILKGNQVDVDGAKLMMKNLKMLNHINFIDISDSDYSVTDNDCRKHFLNYKFEFSFILTKNGIIIARGLPIKQDNELIYEDIQLCSLYIGNEEMLSSINGQNILHSVNPLHKLSTVYIALLKNEPKMIQNVTNIMPLLEFTQEIYLCIPYLNSAIEALFQHDKYKSALILTSEFLYAANCKDTEELADILNHSRDSIKSLEIYNCELSFSLLHKFSLLLCKHGGDKEWERMSFCNCSLSDEHFSYFAERCNEYMKGQTTLVHCVNLSNNALTSTAVDKLISLLDMWRSEELYISHNDLQYSGFERLVHSSTSGSLSLRVLDIQYNNIDCSSAEKLCEEIFLNSKISFCCQMTLKEKHYNCIVLKHATTSCVSPTTNNCATLPDKKISTNSRSSLFLQSNDDDEVIHQLSKTMMLNKLYLITDISDQSIISTCLKNQRHLTELYLYARNWLSDQLIIQQLTSSCQLKLVVSSDKIEASKVTSLLAITEGVSLLPSCVALNTIKVNHCVMNKECLILLNTFLWTSTQPRSLKCLDLSCCSLEKNISHILKSPGKSIFNISIETVDLSSNKLDSATMDLIVNFMICLKVKQLYLNDNKIENEGIKRLVSDLIAIEDLVKGCRLDFLDMSGNLVEHNVVKSVVLEIHKIFSNRKFCLFMDTSVLVQGASQMPRELEHIPLFTTHCYVFDCGHDIIDYVKEELSDLKEIVICNVNTPNAGEIPTITNQVQVICGNNSEATYVTAMNGEIHAHRQQADWIEVILSEISTVNVIRLNDCGLNEGVISKLAVLIQNTNNISEVSLTGCKVTSANCKFLSQSLCNSSTCCKVTSLNVSDNLITSSAVNEIVDLLCALKIEKLYMNNNRLCDSGISQFSKKLGKSKHGLTYVEFKGNNTKHVTEYEFISNSRYELMQVTVNKNAMFFNGVLPPANQFDDNIENLFIINYNFSVEQLTGILALTLRRLYLRGTCNISTFDNSINIQVKELFIVLENLNDEAAKQIFKIVQCSIVIASKSAIRAKNCHYAELVNIALRESQKWNLKFLHFISCDFIDYYQEFAAELQNTNNKHWKYFQLRQCNFNDDRIVALTKLLTSAGIKCEVVDLSCNLLTSQSAETVGDMIKSWQIKELYLNDNQIGPEGMENIVSISMMTSQIQNLNFKHNNKTNYTEIAIERIGKQYFSLNKVDCLKQSSECCVIMVICGNDTFYFLTIPVIDGDVVICDEQSDILEKDDTKIYVNARSFTSSHFINRLTKSRRFEELYILSNDNVFDSYKKDPLMETELDIIFTISTTTLDTLQFKGCNHPSFRIIVNSCKVLPKKLINLPNMYILLQVLPIEGVEDAMKDFLSFIVELSSIRALYINCNKEFSKACNHITGWIVSILELNCDLEVLNISDNDIGDSDFSKISEKLKCISSLKSIDIRSNEITDKNLFALELVLQNNHGLKEINFSDICINEMAYSTSLRRLTQLTTLKLSRALIGMSKKVVANLSEIIANNVGLEYFDISGNQIGDSISKIFEAMQHHKSLKMLNVSSNQLSGAAFKSLFTVLENNVSLQDIDLSNNQLLCEDCICHGNPSIAKSLKRKQLKKLNVRCTGASNSDTNDYITILKDCNALEEIDLSLGNLQIDSILTGMSNISTLRKVCLRKCNIDFFHASNLANLISQNTLLELLDISENKIGIIGFQRVLSALVNQTNKCCLKVLQVAKNMIFLNSALLDKISPKKLRLLELDISNNIVEESFIVNLFENFIDLKSLQILNIGQTCNDPSHKIDGIIRQLINSATELKELDISGYTLTCDGSITFQQHRKLKAVTLRNCNMNNSIAEKLKLLFDLNNLKYLDVSNNPIEFSFAGIPIKNIHTLKLQDCCVFKTNEWMLNSNSLRELHLCNNDLGDGWFNKPTEILASFIAQSALSLNELCLRQCKLKFNEMIRIVCTLKSIHGLKIVHLCSNKIHCKSSDLSKLKSALAANNTLEMLCILDNSMSREEAISLAITCAVSCNSIRCVQLPRITQVDVLTQIRSIIEDIKEERSKKGNYNGLYAVFTNDGCVH